MNITNDINALKRMLREISETAEEASLTHSLRDGAARLDQHYRGIVQQLVALNIVGADSTFAEPAGPNPPSMGQIAVDSRMLLAMLGVEKESTHNDALGAVIAVAPFMQSEDLFLLLEQRLKEGASLDLSVLPAVAPFLSSEAIGKLIRHHVSRPAEPITHDVNESS